MPKVLTQAVIEEWIGLIPTGKFSVHDIWNEVGIDSPENKAHLRVILGRLEVKGTISSSGGGIYRKTDGIAPEIDWQNADPKKTVPLVFPFGEHELARIYPKSIVILAGSKNAGKTAYLLNVVALNMQDFQVDFYNSETSAEQLHERLSHWEIPKPAPFKTYQRYDNFADVIHPDHISVIDYLDLNSEVYLVGAEIDAIFRKLDRGVAVIGLQKPPPSVSLFKGEKKYIERDLAYGGAFTAKRAVLYISMSGGTEPGKPGHLKLVYVKTPANPTIKPDNMAWNYEIGQDGVTFQNVERDYGEDIL